MASGPELPFQTLAGSPVRLGFGCAELPVHEPRKAANLLACAYDLGVRHFDVARLYGYGLGEPVLGKFLEGRRDGVTITTKFGLEPDAWNTRARLRETLNRAPALAQVVRRLKAVLRPARAPQSAPAPMVSGRFSVANAQSTLESSLRQLRTDRVDLWLLHEASSADASQEEVLQFVERMKQQGKVRAIGVGTASHVLLRDLDAYPASLDVLQFDSHLTSRNVEQVHRRRPIATITHGSLRPFADVRAVVRTAPASAHVRFHNSTGVDLRRDDELARLLLRWSIARNPSGGVLFSSRRLAGIRDNVMAATDIRLSPAILERFEHFVRDCPLGMKAPL